MAAVSKRVLRIDTNAPELTRYWMRNGADRSIMSVS